MGKHIKNSSLKLHAGDLLVLPNTKMAGVLLQKHKVLRSYTEHSNFNRWYYAWRIKWNKETSTDKVVKWITLLDEQIDEQKLINDIESGEIEHYSKNSITCN
tara:strand:- start:162 stop:467 length:306 start_codon:yes stop_codon:yes gene_type:complete